MELTFLQGVGLRFLKLQTPLTGQDEASSRVEMVSQSISSAHGLVFLSRLSGNFCISSLRIRRWESVPIRWNWLAFTPVMELYTVTSGCAIIRTGRPSGAPIPSPRSAELQRILEINFKKKSWLLFFFKSHWIPSENGSSGERGTGMEHAQHPFFPKRF